MSLRLCRILLCEQSVNGEVCLQDFTLGEALPSSACHFGSQLYASLDVFQQYRKIGVLRSSLKRHQAEQQIEQLAPEPAEQSVDETTAPLIQPAVSDAQVSHA